MTTGTAVLLVAGAAGAGAAVYFFVIKPRQAAAVLNATAPANTAAPPAAVSTRTVAGVNVTQAVTGDHVARRDAIAPAVINKLTGGVIPTGVTSTITGIASKLSISGYAEKYISTKVPIVGKIAEAPISAVKGIVGGIASLF